MRKLVIANRGTDGIGKSSAIKAVYHLLKGKGYKAIEEKWQGEDIKAIFIVEDVKVGISSQGNPESYMKDILTDFVETGCGIIVTACQMDGDVCYTAIDHLAVEQDYVIIWYAHYRVSGDEELQKRFNGIYSEQVVKLIEGHISGKF